MHKNYSGNISSDAINLRRVVLHGSLHTPPVCLYWHEHKVCFTLRIVSITVFSTVVVELFMHITWSNYSRYHDFKQPVINNEGKVYFSMIH